MAAAQLQRRHARHARNSGVLLLAATLAAAATAAAAAAPAPPPQQQDVCLGVAGLCDVPVSGVVFLGTHNSAAIASELGCPRPLPLFYANQALPITAQLNSGARALNLDADWVQTTSSTDVDGSGSSSSSTSGGRLVWTHGRCANARTSPQQLFDAVGAYLEANPSETVILHVDDNERRGDDDSVVATMRAALRAALAGSQLAARVYSGPLDATTPLRALRGRAVVVLDQGSWGGGGSDGSSGNGSDGGIRSSSGLWAKSWSDATSASGALYASDPAAALATRTAVAAQLLQGWRIGGGGGSGSDCSSSSSNGDGWPAFRSFSLGSGDYRCAGATLASCQLPVLAAASNTYAWLADLSRRAAASPQLAPPACEGGGGGNMSGSSDASRVRRPGANVLFVDFLGGLSGGSAGSGGTLPEAAALARDLNRAAALGGCAWAGQGGSLRVACAPTLSPPSGRVLAEQPQPQQPSSSKTTPPLPPTAALSAAALIVAPVSLLLFTISLHIAS